MVKPSEAGQDSHTYQQALDDFSITQLLLRISNYSDADCDAYAQHRVQWAWKYLIWLTDSSPVVVADTAWEQDIEPLAKESAP